MVATQDPVGSMRWLAKSGSGYEDGPKFICCVYRQQPHIHEVWNFCADGVTSKVHMTEQVDVSA